MNKLPLRFTRGELTKEGYLTRQKFEEIMVREGKKEGYTKIYDFDYQVDFGTYFCGATESKPGVMLFWSPVLLDKEKDIMFRR